MAVELRMHLKTSGCFITKRGAYAETAAGRALCFTPDGENSGLFPDCDPLAGIGNWRDSFGLQRHLQRGAQRLALRRVRQSLPDQYHQQGWGRRVSGIHWAADSAVTAGERG